MVLADDEPLMLGSLRLALEDDARFDVVAEVADGAELPGLVQRLRPQVVLMDVHMPGGGPELCRAITEAPGAPAVMVISADHQGTTVRAYLRAGATAYLGKGLLGEGVADAVARCAQGQVVIGVPRARELLRGWIDGGA